MHRPNFLWRHRTAIDRRKDFGWQREFCQKRVRMSTARASSFETDDKRSVFHFSATKGLLCCRISAITVPSIRAKIRSSLLCRV